MIHHTDERVPFLSRMRSTGTPPHYRDHDEREGVDLWTSYHLFKVEYIKSRFWILRITTRLVEG